jgi:hypothetical protein
VNAIEVRAVDGNNERASAVFRVARKTSAGLTLFPNAVSVSTRRDERGIIQAVTSSGHAATDVGWRVADDATARLESYAAQAAVTGTRVGRTSVSAHAGGRIATATVAVVTAPSDWIDRLPPGTVEWAVGPIRGLRQRPPLNAEVVVDSPPSDADVVVATEGCDLFAVDVDPVGRFAIVRGMRMDGNLVWIGRIPGLPLAGDPFGGLLALVGRIGRPSRVLGRFDRADARAPIWRYHAFGDIQDFAQSAEGTIYLVERRQQDRWIVAIDGQSGESKYRFSVSKDSTLGDIYATQDGSALVQQRNAEGLSLMRVTGNGLERIADLSTADHQSLRGIATGPITQTGNGDVIAFWADVKALHISLVSGPSVTADFTVALPAGRGRHTWHVLVDAFAAPWVYLSDGRTLQAIDLQSGERRWRRQTTAVPFEAIDERHVVVTDPMNHRIMELDEGGSTVTTMKATVRDARLVTQSNGIFHGFDPVTRSVVEVAEPVYRESGWFFVQTFTTRH